MAKQETLRGQFEESPPDISTQEEQRERDRLAALKKQRDDRRGEQEGDAPKEGPTKQEVKRTIASMKTKERFGGPQKELDFDE